jgi:hypothetical protein
MPLGKNREGRTVGPSPSQRSANAKAAARYPLRAVVEQGVGADPERPYADVDVLECGHTLSGATDLVGRRYPAKRRCFKCDIRPCPHDWKTMYEPGGGTIEFCFICKEKRPALKGKDAN